MRVLLLGASGQIGYELWRQLLPFAELVCATRSGQLPGGGGCAVLDLADPLALDELAAKHRPHVIINAAAYTQVDRAENEPEAAERLNHLLPARLAQLALEHCALLVHYSTDYVFNGQGRTPWREDSPTQPQSVYGRSKLAGELAIVRSRCASLILRTQWIYAARGQNFLLTMLKLAREGRSPSVVADQIGAPTPASWVAAVTVAMLLRWSARAFGISATGGMYHLSASGEVSWFDFASVLLRQAELRGLIPQAPTLHPITTAKYGAAAPRPLWSVLDCGKLEQQFGLRLPSWRVGVDQVLTELVQHRLQ